LLAISIAVSLICILAIGIGAFREWSYYSKSEQKLSQISSRLGVKPDWDSVKNEIYCNVIVKGANIDEITGKLANITPISLHKDDDEYMNYTIYFTDSYVNLDDIGMTFDPDRRLVGKFLRVGLGDVTPIVCP
jgi:hypothetical protein